MSEKDLTSVSANGLTTLVQRDTMGGGSFNEQETVTVGPDGSATDAITSTGGTAGLSSGSTRTRDATGLATTVQASADGVLDETENLTVTTNADGTITREGSEYNANGALRDRIVEITSANGRTMTSTIDLNGDGIVDETSSDATVFNSDGTTTRTLQTNHSDNSLVSKTIITTSANGLVVTTSEDDDGDGNVDLSVTTSIATTGLKTVDTTYYGKSGSTLFHNETQTSADGLQIGSRDSQTVSAVTMNSTNYMDDGTGSYDFALLGITTTYNGTMSSSGGVVFGYVDHKIDGNGVDMISVETGGTSAPQVVVIKTVAREAEDTSAAARAYATVLDRDPSRSESEYSNQYTSTQALVTALLGGSEFSQKYGTLTDAQFIEQIYENADGRGAQVDEVSQWLQKLTAGTATRASIVTSIADSAEHLADGNVHVVTNNTVNGTGTYTLDHTMDTAAADAIVERFYRRSSIGRLTREASRAGRSSSSRDR